MRLPARRSVAAAPGRPRVLFVMIRLDDQQVLLQDKEQTEVDIGHEGKLKEGRRDNSKQCSDLSTLFYQLKSCFSGNQRRKSARALRFTFFQSAPEFSLERIVLSSTSKVNSFSHYQRIFV